MQNRATQPALKPSTSTVHQAARIAVHRGQLVFRSTMPSTARTDGHGSIVHNQRPVLEAINHAAARQTHAVTALCSVPVVRAHTQVPRSKWQLHANVVGTP
jgi:hypothetical protein